MFHEYTVIFLDKSTSNLSSFGLLTEMDVGLGETVEKLYPHLEIIRINSGFHNRRLDNEYYDSEAACI